MGMLLGLGVPGLVAYAKQARLRATTRQVVGLVSLARSTAISSRQALTVVVDADGEELRLEDAAGEALETKVRLPQGLDIRLLVGGETPAEAAFTFRSNGALTGRPVALTLSHAGQERTVTVTAATGAIAVE